MYVCICHDERICMYSSLQQQQQAAKEERKEEGGTLIEISQALPKNKRNEICQDPTLKAFFLPSFSIHIPFDCDCVTDSLDRSIDSDEKQVVVVATTQKKRIITRRQTKNKGQKI